MDYLLNLKNISAGYNNNIVLKNLNLKIMHGDKILIVGPNGAGKSTIFKVITGLINLKKGEILYDEINLEKQNIKNRIEKGMGYLLQDKNIIPSLTVMDNLKISGYFLIKREFYESLEKIFYIIPELKFSLHKKAGLLSGGEKQLLAISMILIRKPILFLLDEPISGLSPDSAKKVINALSIFQKEFNLNTLCLIEHNLKYVIPIVNKIVVIVDGKVAYKTVYVEEFLSTPSMLEKIFFINQKNE